MPARASTVERLLVDISVNGQAQGVSLMARADSRLHAPADALRRWRLDVPETEGVEIDGTIYYPLTAFDGIEWRLEPASMRLSIDIPPELLPATQRSLSAVKGQADSADSIGGFLDYDVSVVRSRAPGGHSESGLLEPTLFTRHGSLSSQLLYNSPGSAFSVPAPGWVRLETAWKHDDPWRMRSLVFGDGVTRGTVWGRSLRFGGFQIASNFDTQPTAVTFPLPTITGTAALPSTLDIYVNGQIRSRLDVPVGAFEINDIPVVTGAGQVQVVARDLLGREQIIATDFYATERLLRAGLSEYSLSVGRLRENFAAGSNDYGDALLSAVLRRGVSDRMTLTGQFEASRSSNVLGGMLARTFGRAGLSSFAVARSSGAVVGGNAVSDAGSFWQMGHQYQGRRFRVDLRVQGTTPGFTQPGVELALEYPRRQLTLSTGVNLRQRGSLGFALIRERAHAGGGRRIASLSYSRSLPHGLLLAVAASRVAIDTAHTEASLTLTRSIGPRASTSFNYTHQAEGSGSRFDHRYDLPAGPGFGYRTSIESGVRSGAEAELLVNRDFAWYSAEYRGYDGDRGMRLQTRGGVARFGGAWFATRSIDEGFAVIDAGGLDDVRVYLENRPIGTTRDDGRLLVPGLRPYEINRLRIETADIPLWIRVEKPEVAVTPYYRAGALASFGVRRTNSVLLRVIGRGGDPLPEGSRARTGGGGDEWPVGLDGRLFLEGVAPGQPIELWYRDAVCRLSLPAFEADAVLANLGDIACVEVPNAASAEAPARSGSGP